MDGAIGLDPHVGEGEGGTAATADGTMGRGLGVHGEGWGAEEKGGEDECDFHTSSSAVSSIAHLENRTEGSGALGNYPPHQQSLTIPPGSRYHVTMIGDLPPYMTAAIIVLAALWILGRPLGAFFMGQAARLHADARVKEAEARHWMRESDELRKVKAQVEDMRRARS